MTMAVVQIRVVRMPVRQPGVPVGTHAQLALGAVRMMGMLMARIMHMAMRVLDGLVIVLLHQMQPTPTAISAPAISS